MTRILIRLPFVSPPLRSNDRLHWAVKAKRVKEIREATALAAGPWVRWRAIVVKPDNDPLALPINRPVVITFVWEVTDHRVRDVGASTPTLKAAIDELVAVGVLASDRHSVVTEERYRIEVGTIKGVRIEIASVGETLDADLRPLEAPSAHQKVSSVLRDATPPRSTQHDARNAADELTRHDIEHGIYQYPEEQA